MRNYAATLAGDLNIIRTRESFSESFINLHQEGSALLTRADQQEEGAKLLALQTRQALQMATFTARARTILDALF